MVRKILKIGNKLLREKCEEISLNDPKLKRIIRDLCDTLLDKEGGVGLAAPQIGEPYRVFVVYIRGRFGIFINPEIYKQVGEEFYYLESCLSVPWWRAKKIKRKPTIGIKYYDGSLNLRRVKYTGIKARVILHEYDHLDGILYLDRRG